MTVVESDAARHRALADASRRRIVAVLRAASAPLDATAVAARVGLHANTVRWHLGVLARAGIVSSAPLERSRPGRPRIGYSFASDSRDAVRPSDEYRLLATILAGTLDAAPEGLERAEQAGSAWGRHLIERPPPFVRLPRERAIARAVRLLDAQGFAPEALPGEIRMRRCPFQDLAERHGRIVCAVHRGLVAGGLDELDETIEVGQIEPFVEPGLCRLRLGSRSESAPATPGALAEADRALRDDHGQAETITVRRRT